MLGLDCLTTTGALTLNGIYMHTGAWCCYGDLTPLWMETRLRGSDATVPGIPGQDERDHEFDATEHSLALAIAGHVDQAGTPYSDSWEGAVSNLSYLLANLVDTGPGTITASLDLLTSTPYTDVKTGDVRVLDIRLGRKLRTQPVWAASLELRILGGRLA